MLQINQYGEHNGTGVETFILSANRTLAADTMTASRSKRISALRMPTKNL
jgi:hypothetical protein